MDEYIHWWLPDIVPKCAATIKDRFTGVTDKVTCPECRKYVDRRLNDGRLGRL